MLGSFVALTEQLNGGGGIKVVCSPGEIIARLLLRSVRSPVRVGGFKLRASKLRIMGHQRFGETLKESRTCKVGRAKEASVLQPENGARFWDDIIDINCKTIEVTYKK